MNYFVAFIVSEGKKKNVIDWGMIELSWSCRKFSCVCCWSGVPSLSCAHALGFCIYDCELL